MCMSFLKQERTNRMVCKEFYHGFLDSLDSSIQERVTEAIHGFQNHDSVELTKIFEDIALDVEQSSGIDSFVGHIIVRHLALLLNKKEDKEGAVEFLNRKLQRIGKDEFYTLITIVMVHDKNGEYREAIEILERAKKSSDSDLKKTLLFLKLAANHWNVKSESPAAYGYQVKGLDLLKELEKQFGDLDITPSTEQGMTLVSVYKTAGYLYRIQEKNKKSVDCYEKAIKIIKKNPESKLQYLKCLAQLCLVKAKDSPATVKPLIDEGMEMANALADEEEFMKAHPDLLSLIYARLAHSCDLIKDLERSVIMRLETFDLMKMHMGKEHPETARISADIALNYYLLKRRDKCDEYIKISEQILDSCGYKEDPVKAKRYFRQISDTLKLLGNLYILMGEYSNAEREFFISMELHKQLYGEDNQKTSKVYRRLGNLYTRWEKKEQALKWLNKAISVQKINLPGSLDLLHKIEKDLKVLSKHVKSLKAAKNNTQSTVQCGKLNNKEK